MRISTNLIFSSLMRNYENTTNSIIDGSKKVSSGKRLSRISEAPSDVSRILSLNRDISTVNDFLNNMNLAKNWLSTIDSVFSKIEEFIQRVRELTIQGANDSENEETRGIISKEIFGILDELIDSANTKSGDRYLFSGTKLDEAPFSNPPNNAVSIQSQPIDGLLVTTSDAFIDLYQLPTGKYRIYLKSENDNLRVYLVDEGGRSIQIDSNGSDDSKIGGNLLSDFGSTILSKVNGKLYGVYDTGRGLKIDLNGVDKNLLAKGLYVDVSYTNGGEVSYSGTNKTQPVKIGYLESVPVTVSGEDAFMASKRLLASQARIEGLSEASTFSSLGIGDGTKYVIDGTTHFGYPVGSATVVGKKPVNVLSGVTYTLRFYINRNGVITRDTLSFTVTDASKGVEGVVDAIKSALEGSSLKNEVEVSSEGNNLVFHLLDPSKSYLRVQEIGSDSLGFKDGVGAWGSSPIYTVKDTITGKGVLFDNATTININVPGNTYSVYVGSVPQSSKPLYTDLPVTMRLYDVISAGTTVSVTDGTDTYTWVSPSDITTVDDFVKAWNDKANWSGGFVPVGVVKEAGGSVRFVSLIDNADSLTFSSTGDTLYKIGLTGDQVSTSYTLDSKGSYSEFSALRIAYYINKGTNYNVRAYTNGFGEFRIENDTGSFSIEFTDPSNNLKDAFSVFYDGSTYKALSSNDTMLEFIKFIENLYKGNVKGYISDGRLWIEDNKGGSSKLSFGVSPLGGARSIFDRFFVAKEGEGIDLFATIKMIANTLKEGMAKEGVDAPSDWYSVTKGDAITTQIFKAVSGKFSGNYSTTWNIKVNLVDSSGNVLPDGHVADFDGVNYKLLVTVTDSNGRSVTKFLADTPNGNYYIRDGLYLTLGAGQVKSGDSFEVKVSSGIESLIGYLDDGIQRVLSSHTTTGAKLKEIDFANSRYTLKNTDLTKEKADLEEVDLTKAITDLQKSQLALQATLQAIVRLMSLTILDYLR